MRFQNLQTHIFFTVPCKDVLQVILAFNEKVATRRPLSSMNRKASVKQTQATYI